MIQQLDAIEALPELLNVEQKLATYIVRAKNDPISPAPIVAGWFVGYTVENTESQTEAQRDRYSNLFQARVAQRDLVMLMALLMREKSYEPYLKTSLETAYATGLKKKAATYPKFKPGDPLPMEEYGMAFKIDPVTHLLRRERDFISIPYTREGSTEWEWNPMDGANWRHPFGPQGPDAFKIPQHPVTQICGEDARAYCKWVGGRLPTLDEWETAARAGAKTTYPWGADFNPRKANTWNGTDHRKNTLEDGFIRTSPVRNYPPNAWAIYDVIGNVFEYCEGHPPWMTAAAAERRICGRGGSWWCSANCCGFFNLLDIGIMIKTATLPNQSFRVVFD